jgi:hypothetical protein
LINTFMLASDYGLVNFVQKVTALCRGKAYFTTPYTLGQYLLVDYMNRKTRTIHWRRRLKLAPRQEADWKSAAGKNARPTFSVDSSFSPRKAGYI